jgi:diguanylate cyclase (GGDEF) domain
MRRVFDRTPVRILLFALAAAAAGAGFAAAGGAGTAVMVCAVLLPALLAAAVSGAYYWGRRGLESERGDLRAAVKHSGRYMLRYDPFADTACAIGEPAYFFGNSDRLEGCAEKLLTDGMILPDSIQEFQAVIEQMRRGEPEGGCNLHLLSREGNRSWVRADYTMVYDAAKHPQHAIVSLYDETEQHEKELEYRKLKTELASQIAESEAYMEVDLTDDAVEQVSGFLSGDGRKRAEHPFSQQVAYVAENVLHPEDAAFFHKFFDRKRLGGMAAAGEREDFLEFRAKLEDQYRWYTAGVKIASRRGKIRAFITIKDIDAAHRERERLSELARRDSLTGLLNHSATERSIREALVSAGSEDTSALFMIDLDQFKLVNDTRGHQSGDRLLREVAQAVNGVFRQGDIVGRIGGDEFMAFLTGSVTEHLAREKADALLEALQFSVGSLTLTASIGISMSRGHELSFEQMYADADKALYQVKRGGRHNYAIANCAEQGARPRARAESEQSAVIQYKTLLEHMEGGIYTAEVTRSSIHMTYASPSLYSATKRSRDDLGEHGENALAFVHPEDLPLLTAAIHRTAETGEVRDLTYRIAPDRKEWRHIRLARFALRPDGTASVIGALSDVTGFKQSEEQLALSEKRYRIADELSHALIWEVDVASKTLYQTAETSRALGYDETVYHNMPDGLLEAGYIHPSSVDNFRRMYADLYDGDDSREYTLLTKDGGKGYIWLRAAFRLIRDEGGRPVRAVGIVEKVPAIGTEMRIFEEELRFSDAAAPSMLGTIRVNLTKNLVEAFTLPFPLPQGSFDEVCDAWTGDIHPDDAQRLFEAVRRESLLRSYEQGNNWFFIEYRRRSLDKSYRWTNLAVNLLRHPVSREIFVFGYFRDVDLRHRWAEALNEEAERDIATQLYTSAALAELSGIATAQMEPGERCAMIVFEIIGYDQVRNKKGIQAAQRLLFNIGRMSRVMIDGKVVIGHINEKQFAVFRTSAGSSEQQHDEILQYKDRARLLLEQTGMDTSLDVACGYAVAQKGELSYEELFRRGVLACHIARSQPGNPVTEYTDPSDAFYAEKGLPEANGEAAEKRRILIADSDQSSLLLLRKVLSREYEVDENGDGFETLEKLRNGRYALLICGVQLSGMDGWALLTAMRREKILLDSPVIMILSDKAPESEARALNLGAADVVAKPIVTETLLSRARNIIGRQEASAMAERNNLYELRFQQQATLLRQTEFDELTGLFNKSGFFHRVRDRLDASPEVKFRLLRWDLDNFKMVNDAFGIETGDRILRDIGAMMREKCPSGSIYARLESDHFAILLPEEIDCSEEKILQFLTEWFDGYPLRFKLSIHIGAYRIDDPETDVSIMCDRALLALRSVKSSFTQRIAWYDESLRSRILEEQELSSEMESALENGQFVLYFQPQVNYDDGSLIGAETLVRWQHPERGLLTPDKFIPLFERNGFITTLDEYIWESTCRYMRAWLDQEGKLLPMSVSVNISRVDICKPGLCALLRQLVKKYDLPESYLRLEITESAYMEDPERLIAAVRELRDAGFTVEMDDFGAGYSSLNTLKDVPVNVLKLDVRFLSKGADDARGGSILSSVIRMAHWLDIPVIAEGVETQTQADYLKSLSCFYMQGYYFGRPMPAAEFESLLARSRVSTGNRFKSSDLQGVAAFWDPSAQTALLFNSFVGGAAILEYRAGHAEILRANDKFYSELETARKDYLDKQKQTLERFEGQNRERYVAMLEEAIRTGDEAECEIQSLPISASGRHFWTHNRVRLLAKNSDGCLFYLSVENITVRKEMEEELRVSREELQIAVSQMGKTICSYDIPTRTLTMPPEYAARHHLPSRMENVPDGRDLTPMLPRDQERYRAFYREILAGQKNCRVSLQIEVGEGQTIWERYESATIFDEAGKPLRAVISEQDVTAQMEREAEDERNRLLLERVGTGIFDYDFQNDFLRYQANAAGNGLQNRSHSRFIETLKSSGIMPDESADRMLCAIEKAAQAPIRGELQFQGNLLGMGQRWYQMHYVSMTDDAGKVYRCVGQVEDISDEKDREELNTEIQLRLGSQTKETFAYNPVLAERALDLLYGAGDDLNGAIDKILETMGLYAHSSRAYIFEDAPDHRSCRNTFEWCASGVAAQRGSLQNYRYRYENGENTYFRNFNADGIFYCSDVRTLSQDLRGEMDRQGIFAMLQYAIKDRTGFYGFVGFDDCQENRVWTTEQIATLMVVARLMGAFLLRENGTRSETEEK